MKMNGARILLESLKREGVDLVFGYPGGTVINLYDELMNVREIRHILPRHEQGGTHAADGYARATGKVGVAIATSGPGATNTITGIATAYMDSIPMVIITGQVPTPLIGNDAFQEVDIIGITRPITKHSFLIRHAKDIPTIVRKAFYIARSGRPGPVLIDFPKDVQISQAEFKWPESIDIRGYKPNLEGHQKQVEKAVEMLLDARRPVMYVGGGVILANAAEELTELARTLQFPVTTTLMGLGAFPENDPLALKMLGMHGAYAANMAMTHSDLILAVGARFDDRVTGKIATFAPHAKIIHIDVDPTSIRKNVRVDLPIVGDTKDVLVKMIDCLKGQADKVTAQHAAMEAWHEDISGWKTKHPISYKQSTSVIKPQYVIQKLRELSEDDAIMATDVGQHQMWVAQFFEFHQPRTLLTSGGLGTMGFGIPSAMGAQAAYPKRQVICVCGDGGVQMNMQELATMVQHRLPVKIVILNNNFLGMVRQWQELFFDKRYSQTCLELPMDFSKIAEAYGAKGLKAEKPSEVEQVIKEGFAHNGPVIMEFTIAREEKVLPMVPAGASLNEMVLNA
ncbi:biosynthetic-type acetolactate synthase large subunit [Trichlorobacter lovleyi]|uniref:biosynthetic-type acetolactate synthase large subunit n=1 Tax=Trichlorobacter lovleyi TaxID=313985 RepID=UPI00224090AE|nr:biosynthetic-type acetolactate synthase large subunit [Trichlorobacter lovleyi]QOX79485.1 biosynthetic-type acetolactate synthase large subunit [Trichlorobacter lovleyi]